MTTERAAAANETCFATIVSANYLAYAGVLARSLAQHAPEAALCVLVVDRPVDAVRAAVTRSGLDVIYATELPIEHIEQVAYKYDIVELNTALKPSFLKALFARGFQKVVYLDPDISLYAAPTPILDALDSSEIVVTPHAMAPAMDGYRPSDVDFLRNGTFNLGFIGLRAGPTSARMLDWWERRCLSYGFNDPTFGIFVDQKWIDLVPSYFDSLTILRHPGCNVAYWNLHERKLEHADGRYTVNGEPLVFFHFSGVRADAAEVLSKHQTRHAIGDGSALAPLVRDYCRRLLELGHRDLSALPYTFGALDDGTPVTGTMRRAFCCDGLAEPAPFSADSPLQRRLRDAGITPRRAAARAAPVSTLNFDQRSRKVVVANGVVKLLARIMGVERVRQMLQYAAFLSRESNYASVLLTRPFNLRHTERR